ncbi:MAG: HAMP domain-containing sensor histidine kinase [Candidatus Krumholzibacteria bacterium]|nr:HAMP domain-containing sensor histidine kinase [Candidatus Krumholzibacteria bacterium]
MQVAGIEQDTRTAPGELRAALLASAGDAPAMRSLLALLLDQAGAEVCAYYTAADCGVMHLVAAGRGLSDLIPGVGEKVRTAFRMFANRPEEAKICREHVHYRESPRHSVLGGSGAAIESYFMTPVTSGPAVSGVLFVGSVRRDAFTRDTIAAFRDLASSATSASAEAAPGAPLFLEGMLASLPYAAALVDAEGSLIAMNPLMSAFAGAGGDSGESRMRIDRVERYDLGGLWDEMKTFGRNITDRRVNAPGDPFRSISVSLVRMERLEGEAVSLLVIRDISAAAAREREREEEMAVVAHEIRTPMTALRNSLRILLESGSCAEGLRSGSQATHRRFLETALRTVDRLAILVDGLVDASPVRRSGRAPRLERVEIFRFISDASILFVNSMDKKEITFDVDVELGADIAFIDREMVEQVVQNLLSNSLKHVPSGGWIRITARRVTRRPEWFARLLPARLLPEPGFISIEIADSGPGIPAAVAERINVPMTADPALIRPAHGLGLYIAARLVRVHGGRLTVGRHDSGSSIELCLPIDTATSEAVRAALAVQSAVASMISTGASPVLYLFVREDGGCWLDHARSLAVRPMINPAPFEAVGADAAFWPIAERFALALTAGREYRENPASLAGGATPGTVAWDDAGSIRTGWAVHPRDGSDYRSLLAAAVGHIETGAAEPLRMRAAEPLGKGVRE